MSRLASMVWAALLAVLVIMLALRLTPPEPTSEARITQEWEQLREQILTLNARLRPLIHSKSPIPPPIRESIQVLEREVDAQVIRAKRIGWSFQRIINELYRIGWDELRSLVKTSEPLLAEPA